MIIVNSAIMQENIKKIVTNIESPKYTFVKKEGIQLYFSCNSDDSQYAANIAKSAIKSDPIGSTLLISVKVAE